MFARRIDLRRWLSEIKRHCDGEVSMTTVIFKEVSRYGFKSGDCVVCGNNCKRKKKFYQTISPFNKNKDGSVKTKEEILFELDGRIRAWQSEPVMHVKCESKQGA